VGNPHSFAKIQNGESVLDVGSGLGIDSFIAAHYAGPTGQVTGLDLSKMEVKHATERAQSRDIADQNLRFVVGDMEQMPFEDESFDVVISNGAFCLAPNKEKAFEEIYRTLKPGGRMAIYTSTVKVPLEAGVNWPVCMRMFIHHSELQPLCEKIGFKNVTIDDSNSLMQYNLPGEDEGDADQPSGENGQHPKEKDQRNRVHVGSAEFKHLQDYDMNAICARVCVIATKPTSAAAQVKES
jgi:SAM-dependent methyltransferase